MLMRSQLYPTDGLPCTREVVEARGRSRKRRGQRVIACQDRQAAISNTPVSTDTLAGRRTQVFKRLQAARGLSSQGTLFTFSSMSAVVDGAVSKLFERRMGL